MFPEAEFKEFEARLKFKTRLKYGWFHLKLYLMFQDVSRRSIEPDFWRLKFIEFRHRFASFYMVEFPSANLS